MDISMAFGLEMHPPVGLSFNLAILGELVPTLQPPQWLTVFVRPNIQSRVNNSCIVFIQSPLSLVMKGLLD